MTDIVTSRIVDTGWLRAHRDDPRVVVVQVTNAPPTADTVYWKDLVWHRSRREFASATDLSQRLYELGAGATSTVVFAGDPPQFAAYVLWVAAAVGVGGDLRYLDGGVPALQNASFGERAHTEPPTGTHLPIVTPRYDDIVVGRDQVRTAIDSATTLLDLRSPEEFSGARVSPQSEPIDHGAERSGHIPGAKSLPAQDFLDSNGRLRPVAEIRALLGAAAVDDAEEIIAYCRLSHRAALGWLVFTELLDDHRVRVYDGSWTEWGSLVGAPVATGRSDDGDGDLP